jgi:hypothetical protein
MAAAFSLFTVVDGRFERIRIVWDTSVGEAPRVDLPGA